MILLIGIAILMLILTVLPFLVKGQGRIISLSLLGIILAALAITNPSPTRLEIYMKSNHTIFKTSEVVSRKNFIFFSIYSTDSKLLGYISVERKGYIGVLHHFFEI